MKFAHLSDLHLGKRLHQFSLVEDQKYILNQIVQIIREEEADGVILAGDIYDKMYPSAEAVALFDYFMAELSKLKVKIFVISGNHDSAERIACLGEITKKAGVYLTPVYQGEVSPISMEDEYGKVNIYLLPFIKPVHVRYFFKEEKIESYTDALRIAIENMKLNRKERNLLAAHQFVTGARRSESEEITVGGLDHVEAGVFADFDYVALGHIHSPQEMGEKKIRYCGTPLKYSFSESTDEKSLTMVELKEKGELSIKTIPLVPLRDLVKIKGRFTEVMNPLNYPGLKTDSYLHVTLLEEEDVPEAFYRLSLVYPNLMQMVYENTRTKAKGEVTVEEEMVKTRPEDIFARLYEEMNHQPLSMKQQEYLMGKINKIWKGEEE